MDKKYVYVDDLISTQERTYKSVRAFSDSDQSLYKPTRQKYIKLVNLLISQINLICDKLNIKFEYTLSDSSKSSDSPSSLAQIEMHNWKHQFDSLRNVKFTSSDVSLCRDLLVKWFNARFNSKGFIYNRKKIPDWIDWFIVAYGYYCRTNDGGVFASILNNWIASEMESSKFPLPQEISSIGDDELYYTSQAAVIELEIKKSLYKSDELINQRSRIFDKWQTLSQYSSDLIFIDSGIEITDN